MLVVWLCLIFDVIPFLSSVWVVLGCYSHEKEKYATNMFVLFCGNNKTKILPFFFTPNSIEVYEVRYIWYQSQVETLGSNWAQNAPTCLL